MNDDADQVAWIKQKGQEYGIELVQVTLASLSRDISEAEAIQKGQLLATHLKDTAAKMRDSGVPTELVTAWLDAGAEAVGKRLDDWSAFGRIKGEQGSPLH